MDRTARIYVAGGDTLIGAALLARLGQAGYEHLVGAPPDEPDLSVVGQVEDFFAEVQPDYVFLTAGHSGGIQANMARPADLMLHNLLVATHVIQAAHLHGVKKLLYLGSSCSYPLNAPQPLRVESLMSGALEPTSDAYAMAKLAGLKLCQAFRRQYGSPFITAIPANAFGPHDDFCPATAHVLPALLRKIHEAKERGDRRVVVWGTGSPLREFLYAADLADACLCVMMHYDEPVPINLGGGTTLTIAEVAHAIAEVVDYRGQVVFDATHPDGVPAKTLDASPLYALGWRPCTPFRTALEQTYAWFATQEEPTDVPAAV
jgi:GDP-L-fucose synthase